MKTWAIGAVGGLLACGPALGADNGFVIGGALGQSQTEVRVGNFNLKDNNAGFKLFAGLRPLDQLGVELEYVDFGKAVGGSVSSDHSALAAFAVGYLPLPPSFDIYGKLGLTSWKSSTRTLAAAFHDSGSDVAYGAGLQFRLGSLSTRLEYEEFGIQGGDNLGFLSLGVAWTIL